MKQVSKNILILLGILLLFNSLFLVYFFYKTQNSNNNLKNEEIWYTHSFTKAICNNNFCQDFEVFCKDKTIIEMKPITGAFMQIDKEWKDPRDEETKNRFC
ncbi:MAG: hypothetical protein KatS3mg001_580 [Candidatus Pacearchaeota archaeon]|nr:MAG: hypothetical protein KatS3mg001_580 [Candidatus Pacearchaeota archaeon]